MNNNVWKGFKDFIVYDKVQEDRVVTSFYLKAADDMPLPKALPGQFIAVRIQKGEKEYSTKNSEYHAFKDELSKLNIEENIDLIQIYTRPLEEDKENVDFDFKGRINKDWIANNLPMDGEFYFCGPIEFMRTVYKSLESLGIEKSRINFELFAAGEDITK